MPAFFFVRGNLMSDALMSDAVDPQEERPDQDHQRCDSKPRWMGAEDFTVAAQWVSTNAVVGSGVKRATGDDQNN
jgi:hypothetical protein